LPPPRFLGRRARLHAETGPEQEILGWIPGRRELGKEDEIGAGLAGLASTPRDLLAVCRRGADHATICASAILKVFASQSQTLV
jgi:hypothetical protein